ncbi:MAG: CBS domain-containing protein [Deinococcus-Thermus bacterium]|jgi:stage IV sporulation protein FB|nr:CBS domain-containing protein [Deinococcota bacterium]
MTWSFPIGRILGSELRVHATFFLLLLWIAAAAWVSAGPSAALFNTLFVLALFACVVLHEFGHALAARRYGIRTPDITLLPIGGLARLERMPEDPGQEIIVALAGPAVNVVIWAVLVFVVGADTSVEALQNIEDPASGFLGRLAAVNLFLVLFNMIPAFPMDGGRVFRALLAIPLGRLQATRVAARAGQILAFVFGFLGLTTGAPILLLIAIFVFIAATSESSDVALRDMARDVLARDAMITSYEALAPDDRMHAAATALLRTTQGEFPVIGPNGRVAGMLTRNAIFAAINEDRRNGRIDSEMETDVPEIGLTAPLSEALDALYTGNKPAVAVTDRSGVMLGYITRENIGELMVVSGRDQGR